jgi:hypothetical protein
MISLLTTFRGGGGGGGGGTPPFFEGAKRGPEGILLSGSQSKSLSTAATLMTANQTYTHVSKCWFFRPSQ